MTSLFVACAALGAVVLATQTALGLLGLGLGGGGVGEGAPTGETGMAEGLALLSVRSLSAGVAFFGVGGLAAQGLGLPGPLAALAALLPGAAALIGTALLMRQVLRLESDGTPRIADAVGTAATVYLPIPGTRQAAGKVHLALQGRTLELQAVTSGDASIPTGTPVVVVAVLDPDTVEVVPTSIVEEVLDVHP